MMSRSFRIFENKMVIPCETLIASQGLEFEVKWISSGGIVNVIQKFK